MDTYGEETEEWEEGQIRYGGNMEEMYKGLGPGICLKELRVT